MSCPYFEIKRTDNFENIAEIINADIEPKHFIRQRRYTPFDVSNDSIQSAFGDKIRCSQSSFFNALRFFSIIFPIMIAVSIYVMIMAEPKEKLGLIAIPITTLFIGIFWGIFLFCHTIEFAFIKSVSDLFILYDKTGNHYCVEKSKKRIRVLYDGTLYVIKGKKIKAIRKERKLYYAYLNMFPQSVLNMGKYVDNSNRHMQPVLIPRVDYLSNGSCVLSLGERGPSRHGISNRKITHIQPLLQHLHFCKYIFTINNVLKLTSIYSAARENAIISYDALTLSTVTEQGEKAIEALKQIILNNSILNDLLRTIDNSF